MLEQNFYNRLRIADIILGHKFELLKLRVLAHQILNRILKCRDQFSQVLAARWRLDIQDDFMLGSQFLGDRQGIFRRTSVRVVVDDCFCHSC